LEKVILSSKVTTTILVGGSKYFILPPHGHNTNKIGRSCRRKNDQKDTPPNLITHSSIRLGWRLATWPIVMSKIFPLSEEESVQNLKKANSLTRISTIVYKRTNHCTYFVTDISLCKGVLHMPLSVRGRELKNIFWSDTSETCTNIADTIGEIIGYTQFFWIVQSYGCTTN